MYIKEDYYFEDLENRVWSGAVDTLRTIRLYNKMDELMSYLEEIYITDEEVPTITEINDFLWFEADTIFEALGINDKDEEED